MQVQTRRAGAPVFDVVVEVERGDLCTWSVVRNVDLVVDAILDGKPYQVEKRTCIPQEISDPQQEVNPKRGSIRQNSAPLPHEVCDQAKVRCTGRYSWPLYSFMKRVWSAVGGFSQVR